MQEIRSLDLPLAAAKREPADPFVAIRGTTRLRPKRLSPYSTSPDFKVLRCRRLSLLALALAACRLLIQRLRPAVRLRCPSQRHGSGCARCLWSVGCACALVDNSSD